MPMSPVEQTSTSSARSPSSAATSAHMRSASARPGVAGGGVGVAAVEDDGRGRARRWRRGGPRLTCTGAAVARLAVNTAGGGDRLAVGGGHEGQVGRADWP